MITLGIPVLSRYDLLKQLIESAECGSIVPHRYIIIDNGYKFNIHDYPMDVQLKINLLTHTYNVGVAKSWNDIIHISDGFGEGVRIISNDDLVLGKHTIKQLLNNPHEFTGLVTDGGVNLFSIFKITNECVRKVGYFDETISPNYAYFEDNDYCRRMELARITIGAINTDVQHVGSATLKAYNNQELEEHHRKFKIARTNYIRKWGGMPGAETFDEPYNGIKR